ncbi:MAG: ATP-binding protein [Acidobacteriota bacterium]
MPLRRSIFLVAAFAALLTVSALAAWAVWQNAREAQGKIALLHERDLAAHQALSDIRSNVYQIAILSRDFLMDSAASGEDYNGQFAAFRDRVSAAVQELNQSAQDTEQRKKFNSLTTELQTYMTKASEALNKSERERGEQMAEMLRKRGARRRDIVTLTETIEQLTLQRSTQERARLADADRSLRLSLGWISSVALLLGIGISGFTLLHMRKLEDQSQISESALRSLSGQLRTAQEQERKSLSRELHDQVGQMLTGLRMELTAIGRARADSQGDIKAPLDRAKHTVEQTLGIVRNIAMLLRPSMLDDLGLTPALAWLMKEVSRTSGMEILQDVDPVMDSLPDSHRTCIFRIVQEAVTNAARHSGARTVQLKATTKGGLVHVTVVDDGKGFDTTANRRKGLGLLGMEERVRELGGQLRVLSTPGRGTSIEIVLPQPATMEVKDGEGSDRRRSRDRADRVTTAI